MPSVSHCYEHLIISHRFVCLNVFAQLFSSWQLNEATHAALNIELKVTASDQHHHHHKATMICMYLKKKISQNIKLLLHYAATTHSSGKSFHRKQFPFGPRLVHRDTSFWNRKGPVPKCCHKAGRALKYHFMLEQWHCHTNTNYREHPGKYRRRCLHTLLDLWQSCAHLN